MFAPDSAAIRTTPRTKPHWRWIQRWSDLLFAHWEVPADVLRRQLPLGLDLDVWGGRSWVSAVAFRLGTRLRGWPTVPFCSNLLELNLRTYVRFRDEPAVWFMSMYGSRRLAVWLGRRLTPLPYSHARISRRRTGELHRFTCLQATRTLFAAEFRPIGDVVVPPDGSLDSWLLERYRAYVTDCDGRLWRMNVDHPKWQIRLAAIRVTAHELGQSRALDLGRSPDRIHFSAGLEARVGSFEEVPARGDRC